VDALPPASAGLAAQTVQASPEVFDALLKWVVDGTIDGSQVDTVINAVKVRRQPPAVRGGDGLPRGGDYYMRCCGAPSPASKRDAALGYSSTVHTRAHCFGG